MAIDVILGGLHVLGFATYIGGLVYSELVLAPAASAVPPAQEAVIARKAGDRQMIIAWTALILILVTGALRLARMHMLEFPGVYLLNADVAKTTYGHIISVMFALWLVLVELGLVMTFGLRPILTGKIDPTQSSEEQAERQERMMSAARRMTIMLRVDLAVAIVIAMLGVSLPLQHKPDLAQAAEPVTHAMEAMQGRA